MISRWKILAPIDLSLPAEGKVRYVICVAAALGADLHLLSVVDGDSACETAGNWPPNANGEGSGIDICRVLLHGPVASTIADYADSIDTHLILMASRSYGRWTTSWTGSIIEDVMRVSRRPVCIISATAMQQASQFQNQRILCVLGFDSREIALVQYAEDIAARIAADLVLLHIVPESSEALLYLAADGGSRPLSKQWATKCLEDLARTLRTRSTTSVIVGNPRKCVGLAVIKHSIDLVLISRGRDGLQATYSDDLSGIIGELHCPLLTIPVDTWESMHPDDRK